MLGFFFIQKTGNKIQYNFFYQTQKLLKFDTTQN